MEDSDLTLAGPWVRYSWRARTAAPRTGAPPYYCLSTATARIESSGYGSLEMTPRLFYEYVHARLSCRLPVDDANVCRKKVSRATTGTVVHCRTCCYPTCESSKATIDDQWSNSNGPAVKESVYEQDHRPYGQSYKVQPFRLSERRDAAGARWFSWRIVIAKHTLVIMIISFLITKTNWEA